MSSKVFVVTGASRGLGLAIAQILLRASHKVFVVARSESGLQKIKSENPSNVEFMAADLADFSVGHTGHECTDIMADEHCRQHPRSLKQQSRHSARWTEL